MPTDKRLMRVATGNRWVRIAGVGADRLGASQSWGTESRIGVRGTLLKAVAVDAPNNVYVFAIVRMADHTASVIAISASLRRRG
jgi:hypothetical protein